MLLPFGPLLEGVWIERRKRFMLDVALDDGTQVTAHCANTGAMSGVNAPGSRVLLSTSDNPKRRYPLTLEAVRVGPVWVGVNTQKPNRLALLMARAGRPPFPADASVKPEVRYGTAERIDLLLTRPDASRLFVEVKNVHLVERPGEASFPDCVTARGARHLEALGEVVGRGERAMLLFLIQRSDVSAFRLARHIDPAYAAAFDRAAAAGVAMRAIACEVGHSGIVPKALVPVLDLAEPASRAA